MQHLPIMLAFYALCEKKRDTSQTSFQCWAVHNLHSVNKVEALCKDAAMS